MLLKEALLDILIKLADNFDMTDNEDAAKTIDKMIEDLNLNESESLPEIKMEVSEEDREEILEVLEQALESMRNKQ
jgi:hypothetical protein